MTEAEANFAARQPELRRAITNSLEYRQRMAREAAYMAAGGTILPCLPVRISWWRRIWRWLASLASISSRN